MLNQCKNSVKILKIACIHVGTVANEGITKNALLDQKTNVFFHTGVGQLLSAAICGPSTPQTPVWPWI